MSYAFVRQAKSRPGKLSQPSFPAPFTLPSNSLGG